MDLNELIQDSVRQVLAESRTTTTEPTVKATPADQPITLNIQGQPYTFKDQADLEAQLNQVAIAQRQSQAIAQPAEPVKPTGSRVTSDDDTGFSNDEYIKLMNEDPRKATNYALSHILFDGKIDNPAELIRESMIQQATTNRQLAAYQFRDAHREVPIEDPRVGNTLEETRKELNLPFTAQGLEASYIYAVSKGKLPDFRQIAQNQTQGQPQQVQPQYQQPQQYQPVTQQPQPVTNPYLAAPPSPGRSTSPTIPFSLDQIEDLTLEQHASLLRKLQSAGAV